MKLSELIAQVGDAYVSVQPLDGSFIRGEVKARDAEITFATEKTKGQSLITSMATGVPTDYVGLVVWLPRERLPKIP